MGSTLKESLGQFIEILRNNVPASFEEKTKEFDEMQCNVKMAANRGYVDNIIEGPEIRKQLIYAMQMFGMR